MLRRFLIIVAALAFTTSAGRANVLSLDSIAPETEGYRWSYVLDNFNSYVTWGNIVTIYDFVGFIPGTNSEPSGWSFSAQLTGITPALLSPNDDPNLMNLTWTRIDDETVSMDWFTFSAASTFNEMAIGSFAANYVNHLENLVAVSGFVAVPVPEPSAAGLLALGGLALLRRRTRTVCQAR